MPVESYLYQGQFFLPFSVELVQGLTASSAELLPIPSIGPSLSSHTASLKLPAGSQYTAVEAAIMEGWKNCRDAHPKLMGAGGVRVATKGPVKWSVEHLKHDGEPQSMDTPVAATGQHWCVLKATFTEPPKSGGCCILQ